MIDIGTGDGLFVYKCALLYATKFYIGIDANPRPLEKISEKVHRKPAKGGAPNTLFLQAAIEDLPSELDGVAGRIHIQFPWGSLLQAVANGDVQILRNIRRLCADDALLEVIIALDPERDRSEIESLQIPLLTRVHIESVLTLRFEEAGFEIVEHGECAPDNWPELHSSWAKRLKRSTNRSLIYIIARAL